MALNLKDPEAHQLAKALQKETGESLTGAVKQALRERLERVRRSRVRKGMASELMEIGKRCAKLLRGKPIDHDELLYDDRGLPK